MITDETAASGGQSLRIQDGPEFKQSYNPHLVYRPAFNHGVAHASFDLRASAEA